MLKKVSEIGWKLEKTIHKMYICEEEITAQISYLEEIFAYSRKVLSKR